MIATYTFTCASVWRQLVVVVRGTVFGSKLESEKVQILICGDIRVCSVELFVFVHEIRLYRDLGFGEVERFAPVVSGQHDFHQGLEAQTNLFFEFAISLFWGLGSVPHLSFVDHGLISPELWNSWAELD